ncbi:MAG: BatA domain-containing protein [Candidatus Eisenbacteria bacterium]|nr:BatA domain-containing protein [Candidatus Eisenbacteria bacterium]
MNFLNPLFLSGLAAAALPILIHLFTRRRPREVEFPSLEFLSEVHQSEIRRLKLKQWLLLALRTLAVAAIAIAMARPALRGSAGGRSGAATTVLALVDVSGSMNAAAPGGGTLGSVARRAVDDLLSTLGPSDEMLLVPYDRAPHPVTPGPSSDPSRLRAAVRALDPGAAATDHAAALAFAARSLAESHSLNRELFWISDFQSSGFADSGAMRALAGPWDRARIYLVPLAPRTRANAALTSAMLAPTETGTALAIEAAAFDVPAGDLAVSARAVTATGADIAARPGSASDTGASPVAPLASGSPAGGADLGRGFLALPSRGRASALIPLSRLPEPGGEVRIPDDALPLDDARWFTSGPAATLRVLLREDGGPSPLRLALEAGSPASGLTVEAVSAAALAARAGQADVIVIADCERLSPPELQAVLDFWRAGGALLVALGSRSDPAFWNAALRELGVGALGATESAPAGSAWRLKVSATGHPALAGFPSRVGEPLSAARFGVIRACDPGRGRVLLEYDGSHPALIEAPHAMVLVTVLDPAATDFAVSGAFLPLLHQAVKVLGRGTASASLTPGDRYHAPASTGAWRILDSQGQEVPVRLETGGGVTRIESAPLDRPGIYRVMRGAELRSVFAVNPDPRESNLAPESEAALLAAFPAGRARAVQPGADLARRVREARYGRELWREFVLLALLLLAAEMVIARLGMGGTLPAAQR